MMTDQADNGGMAEFELLRQSAEAGDPDAQFTLGLLFQRGTDGIKAYRPSAIGWYFKAASQGHAEAQGNLGAMFLDEAAKKNSASDADKARNWLTKAASQGNVDAMYRLGLLLRHGYGIEAKPKSARSWFDSSAKGGNAAALTQLGSMSEEAGDAAAAAKFYGEGAEKGDASAQYNLARCLRDGIGVERDPVQSRKWFESAAEQDLSKAQYALGLLLLQDKKTTRSLKQAQRWFQQAATRGDADAQYETGEGFRLGRGSAVDFGRAIAFFRMAADQGHVPAMYGLGMMFQSGAGLRGPKPSDAASMYRRAAMGGHAAAAHAYGIMLAKGSGTELNKAQARNVLEHAVGLGNDEAMMTLAQMLMNDGDLVEAAKWALITLKGDPKGPGQKILESLKAHLPKEGLIDADKRATAWKRGVVPVHWK